jgi:hypothetical protein
MYVVFSFYFFCRFLLLPPFFFAPALGLGPTLGGLGLGLGLARAP